MVARFVIIFATLIIGAVAFPQEAQDDSWLEQAVAADPGGKPSDLLHGCGTTKYGGGKCSSDTFCPAMPEFKIEKKTKLDCIWGTSKTPDNAASSMTAEGSIAQDYVNTGKCEYSVYGNPCAWKETMAYCETLTPQQLHCPWYCNKEELYCAARYKSGEEWEDKPDIVPTGSGVCSEQLDKRYDAHCDPLHWDFQANEKKKIHCRAHAFSRSCNYYYDAALKKYEATDRSTKHEENCKSALKFHSCNPFSSPFLGEAYCKMSCGEISELDGSKEGSANSYGADSGCCDVLVTVMKEKKESDAAKAAAQEAAVNNGSCKDDEAGLQADWGEGYTCSSNVESGYCEYAYVDEMKKYCKASCKLCGSELLEMPTVSPEQLEAASKSMTLIAERMRAKKNPKPTLIEKYLREGYPDMPLPDVENMPVPKF